jgi:hypothetical protein
MVWILNSQVNGIRYIPTSSMPRTVRHIDFNYFSVGNLWVKRKFLIGILSPFAGYRQVRARSPIDCRGCAILQVERMG